MRLLVVDVGNTSTAVGLWSGGRVALVSHIDGGGSPALLAAEYLLGRRQDGGSPCAAESLLGRRQDGGSPCGRAALVAAIAYASVVPRADAAWRRFARQYGLPFVRIDHSLFLAASGLALDYPKPETIGADRLADAAAAVDRYGAPVLVCDFGTAFTAAAVTEDRTWRGGVIAPGLPLMRDYFCARTAKLPRIALGGRCPRIGRSTEEAMRIGARVGARGMVREIVEHLSQAFNARFRLVATGGYASWVLKDLDLPFTVDPTLTLHGTGLLAARSLERSDK